MQKPYLHQTSTLLNRLLKKSTYVFKRSLIFLIPAIFLLMPGRAFCQKLKLNDLEYFETSGVNVLVFSNAYNGFFFDEKTAGIEIVHHGVRTATGGAIRLQNTPEQWDLVPQVIERIVDPDKNSIDLLLRYEEFDFDARINVSSKDDGVLISVYLDAPLPEKLEKKAGFNLEFLPASYFEKTFMADGRPGEFPLYPSGNTMARPQSEKIPQYAGHTTFEDRGKDEFIVAKPLATGKTVILAPEDPERYVKIQSESELMLFDGRNLAQNGWFIVRSIIPSKKTGNVLQWYLEPHAIPGWKRAPVIGFSQAGYHPGQKKIAIIELDKEDVPLKTASLYKVTQDGEFIEKLTSGLSQWGRFLRYNYLQFDFSSIKEPGIYFIQYGDQKTNAFSIDENVYHDIWYPTMDVWFPVQMDHMKVNEAYRTWHGVPFLDDALQAPVNHEHFDGYRMGASTDTKYKPYERIPGLAIGGWFDAGDFDIQTASHCMTILSFVNAWEEFRPGRDETFIDQETRYVDIHRPDGKPDILQQIEHGSLNLVAQVKNIGHPVRGIVVPNLYQYHHLGDASTETDNLPYNKSLKPYKTDGISSGTMDDRWAFTNRIKWLDYYTAGTLAASYRAMHDYNPSLAKECLVLAKKLWDEQSALKEEPDTLNGPFSDAPMLMAALQLFISTKDLQYSKWFRDKIWPALEGNLALSISTAVQAYPYMDDKYQKKLKDYVIKYKEMIVENSKENPYGIQINTRGWGGNGRIISTAVTNYYAHKAFPDIIGSESVFSGLNYIFGCHPYSNISFVSSVGTRSKKITYGNNRADFSFIAGGVVPGLLLLKPDFPENKEDWPFLWGENECVVGTCAEYIFLSNAANKLIKETF
jgi:endoglucanase